MPLGVAARAESYPVRQLVPQRLIVGPMDDVVSVEAPRSTAFLTSELVALEYASAPFHRVRREPRARTGGQSAVGVDHFDPEDDREPLASVEISELDKDRKSYRAEQAVQYNEGVIGRVPQPTRYGGLEDGIGIQLDPRSAHGHPWDAGSLRRR